MRGLILARQALAAVRCEFTHLAASVPRLPAFLALLVQFAQILLGVVSVPLLLRAFGPAKFSMLSILWAIPALVPLIDLGLPRALASLSVQPCNQAPHRQRDALLVAVGLQMAILLALYLAVWLPFSGSLVPKGLANLHGEIDTAEGLLAKFLIASAALSVANILTAFFQARGEHYNLLIVSSFNGIGIGLIPFLVVMGSPSISLFGEYTIQLRLFGLLLGCIFVYRVVDKRRVSAIYRVSRYWAKELLSGGMRAVWYFAISPLLVFGERYVAAYTYISAGTQIVSHLIAVDLGMRFLIVPGVIGQYSFKAIADAGSATRNFDAAAARYMPVMSSFYLLPLLAAICFARELINLWLGDALSSDVTVACFQTVLVALTTCSVSSLLVQTNLAANAMHRLSALVTVELICYPALVFAAIWFRPSFMDLAFLLSLCWALRVGVEAVAMAVMTKDMFSKGSLINYIMVVSGVPLVAVLITRAVEILYPPHEAIGKMAIFVTLGTALHVLVRRCAGETKSE